VHITSQKYYKFENKWIEDTRTFDEQAHTFILGNNDTKLQISSLQGTVLVNPLEFTILPMTLPYDQPTVNFIYADLYCGMVILQVAPNAIDAFFNQKPEYKAKCCYENSPPMLCGQFDTKECSEFMTNSWCKDKVTAPECLQYQEKETSTLPKTLYVIGGALVLLLLVFVVTAHAIRKTKQQSFSLKFYGVPIIGLFVILIGIILEGTKT
jgi:hypothetical protein